MIWECRWQRPCPLYLKQIVLHQGIGKQSEELVFTKNGQNTFRINCSRCLYTDELTFEKEREYVYYELENRDNSEIIDIFFCEKDFLIEKQEKNVFFIKMTGLEKLFQGESIENLNSEDSTF